MTSKPEPQQAPLSDNPAVRRQQAVEVFRQIWGGEGLESVDEYDPRLVEAAKEVLGLPETEQIASILRVLREQLKNKRLLRDQLRERLASDPLQELAELVSKAHEDMAPAAFRREDMAPAIVAAPSGSMIYMVQKGANTVPDLSFLRNAFTALTARFGTRDP